MMEVKVVAWPQVDYSALGESGYVNHYDQAAEVEPAECAIPDPAHPGCYTFSPEWKAWAEATRVEPLDELHEAAGRGCYQSWNRPRPATATNAGYLAHIQEVAHESVFGHGHVTLYVSGVSRALLLELERHQQHMNINLSVLSQRYVDQNKVGVVTPPLFNEDQAQLLQQHWELSLERYDHTYNEMREAGFEVKEARGAARAFLPEATETRFFVTLSIRAVRDIVRKRVTFAADEEIRRFAFEMARQVATIAPNSMQDIVKDLEL